MSNLMLVTNASSGNKLELHLAKMLGDHKGPHSKCNVFKWIYVNQCTLSQWVEIFFFLLLMDDYTCMAWILFLR